MKSVKIKDVNEIPNMIAVVNEATAQAIAKIEGKEKLTGEKEVLKQEAIRDIVMITAGKVEKLWNELNIGIEDKEVLKKYSNYFVKPLVELLDVARKANVDVYEMKYGKKVQSTGSVEKFDDFIKRKLAENKDKLGIETKEVIDVSGSEKENN